MGDNISTFVGLTRVKRVYPLWLLVSFVLALGMIYFEIKLPSLLFWFAIYFLIKDLTLDYNLLRIKRPRVYWAEHAPFSFLITAVGIGGYFLPFLSGYVTPLTAIIFGIDFIIDLYKDLTENPGVYT